MKERAKNFIKWFFIVLGVLFFIQLLILSGIIIGFKTVEKSDFSFNTPMPKVMDDAIKYILEYKKENSKFPQDLDSFKTKKGYDYSYKLTDENNCFNLTISDKKSVKSYRYCSFSDENTSSNSQNYSEIQK